MSIGEHLATARQRAGLTVTEVSRQTRIRETIVRAVEDDEYTGCGGDFYARGFIRAIARAVGADPEPLIKEYDAAHPAPQAVPRGEFLGPVTLAGPRRRRRTNWTALLAVAAVVAFGVAAYVFVAGGGHAQHQHQATGHHRPQLGRPKVPTTSPTPARYVREVVIRLSAVADCWVEFATPGGRYLSQYFLPAGTSQTWVFGRAVDMRLGNPAGVKLIVNGKNPLPAGAKQPITLTLGPSGTSG